MITCMELIAMEARILRGIDVVGAEHTETSISGVMYIKERARASPAVGWAPACVLVLALVLVLWVGVRRLNRCRH